MYRQISIEKRKSEKLSPLFYGPYEVIVKVGSVAYKLKLPKGAKVHPTFHVSLLKRCPDPNITPAHPPNEVTKNRVEREPTFILDRRMIRKKKEERLSLKFWSNGKMKVQMKLCGRIETSSS